MYEPKIVVACHFEQSTDEDPAIEVSRFFRNHAFGDRFVIGGSVEHMDEVDTWKDLLPSDKTVICIRDKYLQQFYKDLENNLDPYRYIYYTDQYTIPNIGVQVLFDSLHHPKIGHYIGSQAKNVYMHLEDTQHAYVHRTAIFPFLVDRDAPERSATVLPQEFHSIRLCHKTLESLDRLPLLSQWHPTTPVEIDFGVAREWEKMHEMWVDLLLALGRSRYVGRLPDQAEDSHEETADDPDLKPDAAIESI